MCIRDRSKVGEYLGIVKEGAAADSTIYLAYPTTFDEETAYATKQSVTGIGAAVSYTHLNTSVNYSDTMGREDMAEVYKVLAQIFTAYWEKAEMDTNIWKMVKEGAIAGDSYAFFGTKDAVSYTHLDVYKRQKWR